MGIYPVFINDGAFQEDRPVLLLYGYAGMSLFYLLGGDMFEFITRLIIIRDIHQRRSQITPVESVEYLYHRIIGII